MNTELEDSLAEALRARAAAVPHTPMPQLGQEVATDRPARRGRLVSVVVAVAGVVAAGAVAVVSLPGGDTTAPVTTTVAVASPAELAPGEVYYSVRLAFVGTPADGTILERQLWQSRERAGEWRQQLVEGRTIQDGRVVPSGGGLGYPEGGLCWPGFTTTEKSCTQPGSWMNATVEFMATASRDPATIADQFLAEVTASLESNGGGGEYAQLVMLKYIDILLQGNGVPADLVSALHRVVAAIPGIEVTKDVPNLLGERGTSYRLTGMRVEAIAIFGADGRYLGSPTQVVRHGVAPGLGEPPSRMLD